MRPCSPPPGLDRLGASEVGTPIELGRDAAGARRKARSGSNAAPTTSRRQRCCKRSTIADTHQAVLAERAFCRALGGTCHSPVAAHARVDGERDRLRLRDVERGRQRADRARRRASRSAISKRRQQLARADAGQGARRRSAACSRADEEAAPASARAGPVGQRRAGAGDGAGRHLPARCSESSRSDGTRPIRPDYDALLLTSANAVRHGGPKLAALQGLAGPRRRRSDRGRGRARAGLQGRDDRSTAMSPTCSQRSRLACACCTWPARIIASRCADAADRPPYRLSLGTRSPTRTCRRSAGWSLPFTARAPARGWPSWPTSAVDDRHRRDQRCGRRGLRQRLGADRGCRPSPTTTACWPSPPGCVTHRRQMTAGQSRQGSSWTARFAWALLLLVAGAALATWGLSRWERARASSGWPRASRCRSSARPARQSGRAQRRRTAGRSRRGPHRRRSNPGLAQSKARPRRPRDRPGGPTPCWSPSPRAGRSIAESRSAISSRCWSSASAGSIRPRSRRSSPRRAIRSGSTA